MQGSTPAREENSGLLELKSLAQSAKRRHSQRVSSQLEAQESLLASTAALDAIALPDPSKVVAVERPVVKHASGTGEVAALPSEIVAESETRSRGLGIWFAALGLMAAASAVAFFVLRNPEAGSAGEPTVAPAMAQVPSTVGKGDSTPTIATEPTVIAADPAALENEQGSPATVPGLEEKVASKDEAADTSPDDGKASASTDPVDSKNTRQDVTAREATAAKKDAEADNANARDNVEVAKDTTAEVAKATETSPDPSSGEIDDVLSAVTGGVAEKKETVTAEKKPTKTSLDRGDVAKAMGAVAGQAKACYGAEQFTGTVSVKFTVAPDGSVSKASATGKHKSSSTGACVTQAVQSATFPAFSGAPTSFTFPFLLSE